jgi:hypothetical protein
MSSSCAAADADVVGRVGTSFTHGGAMAMMAAELADVAAGRVATQTLTMGRNGN